MCVHSRRRIHIDNVHLGQAAKLVVHMNKWRNVRVLVFYLELIWMRELVQLIKSKPMTKRRRNKVMSRQQQRVGIIHGWARRREKGGVFSNEEVHQLFFPYVSSPSTTKRASERTKAREREICSISIVLIKTQGERIALTNYHLMYSIHSERANEEDSIWIEAKRQSQSHCRDQNSSTLEGFL